MIRPNRTMREDFDLDGDSYGEDDSSVLDAIAHVSSSGFDGAACVAWSSVDRALVVTIEIDDDDDTSEVQYRMFGDDAETFGQVFPELIP